jgi:hypothetical protein
MSRSNGCSSAARKAKAEADGACAFDCDEFRENLEGSVAYRYAYVREHAVFRISIYATSASDFDLALALASVYCPRADPKLLRNPINALLNCFLKVPEKT